MEASSVSPIQKCLHDVVKKILLISYPDVYPDNLENGTDLRIDYQKKTYTKGDGIPCLLDLPKVYLVMHSAWEKNVEECIEHESDKDTKKKMELARERVVPYVLSYYEERFRREAQLFIEDMIDESYESFPEWQREFMDKQMAWIEGEEAKALLDEITLVVLQIRRLRNKICAFVIGNKNWIQNLPIIAGHYQIQCESDERKWIAICAHFKSEWIRELKNIIDRKKLLELSGDAKNDVERREEITDILNLHKQIFDGMQKIFFTIQIDENEIKSSKFSLIQDFLASMKYGASPCFNLEAILCFLFCPHVTLPPVLAQLVRKQEAFFDDVYRAMLDKNGRVCELFSYRIDLRAAADLLGWELLGGPSPRNIKTYKHSIKSLKNLMILYDIICPPNKCERINFLLTLYRRILDETKLPYFSYDQRQCILSEFLNKAGIKIEDLAKLFPVSPATIYRKYNAGTLYTEPLFSVYWMAVTGFPYDYLCGNTTLNFYGRDAKGKNKNHYLIWQMFQKEASEGILQVAKDYIAFKYDLTKKDSPYLAYRHPLWSEIDREIDSRINKIIALLKTRRMDAVHDINRKNNEIIYGQLQSNIGDEKTFPSAGDPLKAEKYQSLLTCLDEVVKLLGKEVETFGTEKKKPPNAAPK